MNYEHAFGIAVGLLVAVFWGAVLWIALLRCDLRLERQWREADEEDYRKRSDRLCREVHEAREDTEESEDKCRALERQVKFWRTEALAHGCPDATIDFATCA